MSKITRIFGLTSLILMGMTNTACPPIVNNTIKGIEACALDNMPQVVEGLIPEAMAAISGSPTDWGAELSKLESQGVNIAICVVHEVMTRLGHAASSDPARAAISRDRAQSYLARHGVK
jgi:hypothetical protein